MRRRQPLVTWAAKTLPGTGSSGARRCAATPDNSTHRPRSAAPTSDCLVQAVMLQVPPLWETRPSVAERGRNVDQRDLAGLALFLCAAGSSLPSGTHTSCLPGGCFVRQCVAGVGMGRQV